MLIEEFLNKSPQHGNICLLFLIYRNQTIEALSYALRAQTIEPFALSLLYAKIKELPDLYREAAEADFNRYLGPKMRAREGVENRSLFSSVDDVKNSQFYHGDPNAQKTGKLQQAELFAEIEEEEKKREFYGECLGLQISEGRKNLDSKATQSLLQSHGPSEMQISMGSS